MSGNLNKKFLNETSTFIRTYLLKSKGHRFFQRQADGTNALASGRYTVDLVPAPNEPHPAVYLEPRSQWGLFSDTISDGMPPMLSDSQIPCYFLTSAPGQINQDRLTANVEWFFTDLMTGCQFLAYGNAGTPNIEHNNDDNAVNYAAHLANATGGGLLARVTPGVQYDSDNGECGAIIGRKVAGAWTFFFQRIDTTGNLNVVTLPNP